MSRNKLLKQLVCRAVMEKIAAEAESIQESLRKLRGFSDPVMKDYPVSFARRMPRRWHRERSLPGKGILDRTLDWTWKLMQKHPLLYTYGDKEYKALRMLGSLFTRKK